MQIFLSVSGKGSELFGNNMTKTLKLFLQFIYGNIKLPYAMLGNFYTIEWEAEGKYIGNYFFAVLIHAAEILLCSLFYAHILKVGLVHLIT